MDVHMHIHIKTTYSR